MRSLHRFLAPRSVAVIAGRYAAPAIERLRRFGFAGELFVVSRSCREVAGVPTVPTAAHLPDGVDAVFLAVPAEACPDVVHTLRTKDCGGIACFSSGFAEGGAAGLQERLIQAAGDMPLLGPNCHGFINGFDRSVLWPDEHGIQPVTRGVAIFSQSGNIALNLTMQQRSLPIGLLVSLGNQAMLDAASFLRHVADDPRVTAIGLHLEGIGDPAAFAEAVLALEAAGKPIVVLKTGRSCAGARATVTHTSTLAGSPRIYDAFFARLGIGQVRTVASFAETLKLLHVHGRPRGRRICAATCSGGEAALLADLAEAHGLDVPFLEPDQAALIEASLDHRVRADNPLDYQTFIWGYRQPMVRLFSALMVGKCDLSILVLDYPTSEASDVAAWNITLEAWTEAAGSAGSPAVVVASLPECLPEEARGRLLASGVAPLQGIGEAIEAIAAASTPPPTALPHLNWPRLRGGEVAQLGEARGKLLLAEAGLPVPAGRVTNWAAAAEVAMEIGFPVVLKTASPALAHKSDQGGVALGLHNPSAVAAAALAMSQLGPGVLVERMIEDVVAELIVGVTRDPVFGLVMMLGAGGVLAELLDDSVPLLFPMDQVLVERALGGLRVARLLSGYRGRCRGDCAAVVDAVLTIAAFAAKHAERLVELEVNPLLVLPEGRGVVVADALIRMVEP
jgi:acyl-CoA synthetase (NDP forming)